MSINEAPILSRNAFLSQLEREKKRADRSKSPLSIVIFQNEGERSGENWSDNRLLALLLSTKREIDIIGCIGRSVFAILLLDTHKQGVDHFLKRITEHLSVKQCSVTSATYPDEIFESFTTGAYCRRDALPVWSDDRQDRKPFQFALKTFFDKTCGALAIVLLSPVMLITAFAVGLSSAGPIIFRQVRLGKGGKPFVLYKFRSMYCGMDDRIHREYVASLIRKRRRQYDEQPTPKASWTKLQYDPRITPIGAIIRATKLDELPQLFNVLKGDLSLVGPRPPLLYEVENYEAWHFSRILRAKPGITGLWQIEGSDDTTFDDMVRMDIRYIATWSVLLDLKILFRTAIGFVFLQGNAEKGTTRELSQRLGRKPLRSDA